MKYGKVLDIIDTKQATEIVESKCIGIVICKSVLSDEVKSIFKDTDIAVYDNITDDKIEEISKKINKEEI